MTREFKVSLIVPELKLYDLRSWIENHPNIKMISIKTNTTITATSSLKFASKPPRRKRNPEKHPGDKTKEGVIEEYARQRYPNHVTIGEMRAKLKAEGFNNLHTTSTTAWNLMDKGVLQRTGSGVYVSKLEERKEMQK